jgi:hypothetical protein
MATPFRYPTRIGFPRKSATKPSLKRPAAIHTRPVNTANAMDSERSAWWSPAASGNTEAAKTAQVAASGLTMS